MVVAQEYCYKRSDKLARKAEGFPAKFESLLARADIAVAKRIFAMHEAQNITPIRARFLPPRLG